MSRWMNLEDLSPFWEIPIPEKPILLDSSTSFSALGPKIRISAPFDWRWADFGYPPVWSLCFSQVRRHFLSFSKSESRIQSRTLMFWGCRLVTGKGPPVITFWQAKGFSFLSSWEPSECQFITTPIFHHFPSHLECAIGDSKPAEDETVAPVHWP